MKLIVLMSLLLSTSVFAFEDTDLGITKKCWRITNGSAVYRMNQCTRENKDALHALLDTEKYPTAYDFVYRACENAEVKHGWTSVKHCIDHNVERLRT